jgi:formylglycine-generating enzyme required for sulfatase activity
MRFWVLALAVGLWLETSSKTEAGARCCRKCPQRVQRDPMGCCPQKWCQPKKRISPGRKALREVRPPAAAKRCLAGQVASRETRWNCCWPGQEWDVATARCTGIPQCPEGMTARGDGCDPGCAEGMIVLSGQCCWPGQAWSDEAGRCVGKRQCPPGTVLADEACVEEAPAARRVDLPGGAYLMGPRAEKVTVAPFSMDRTEVTVGAYAACVAAGQCSAPAKEALCNWGVPGKGKHPVNCVSWPQAAEYCAWVGGRLPTEKEWEWAARGATAGRKYPWGDAEPDGQLCWKRLSTDEKRARGGTCAVGTHPLGASAQGIQDLAGNVAEWTASDYGAEQRVIRGGSWSSEEPREVETAHRRWDSLTSQYATLGFRCVTSREVAKPQTSPTGHFSTVETSSPEATRGR